MRFSILDFSVKFLSFVKKEQVFRPNNSIKKRQILNLIFDILLQQTFAELGSKAVQIEELNQAGVDLIRTFQVTISYFNLSKCLVRTSSKILINQQKKCKYIYIPTGH